MKKDIMHNNNTPANELKKFIEDVIEKAYAEYNEKSTAKVTVDWKKKMKLCSIVKDLIWTEISGNFLTM